MTRNASVDDRARNLERAAELVCSAKRIVIVCHRHPDADTIGSALGLMAALEGSGRAAGIAPLDVTPVDLDYLPGFGRIGAVPSSPDLVISVDTSSPERLGENRILLALGIPVLVIDHHISNAGFGSVDLIDARAAASAEICARIIAAAGLPLTPDSATCLYAGLLRDTSGFRSEATTSATLQLAADLAAAGADPALAAARIFGGASVHQLRVEAHALTAMQQHGNGHIVWSEVDRAVAGAASDAEVEGAVDQLSRVDTASIAILLHEVAPNSVEVHIRTRPPCDAATMAVALGGGGHARRSGARLEMSLDQARRRVLDVAQIELYRHGSVGIG